MWNALLNRESLPEALSTRAFSVHAPLPPPPVPARLSLSGANPSDHPKCSHAMPPPQVVENSEVLSVMPESPDVHNLLTSIYNCKYDKFFDALVVISERVQRNVWLESHTNYYFRELRILAFKQFLASYRSVTLEKMAQQFSISPELLDEQLCCFIAANRLNCKIDKVSGQVITARFDSKNNNYQMLLKNGDLLLNKLQKLARIVGT